MDESIRFADILFTALTLLVIYLILALVKKSRKSKAGSGDPSAEPETTQSDTGTQPPDQEST